MLRAVPIPRLRRNGPSTLRANTALVRSNSAKCNGRLHFDSANEISLRCTSKFEAWSVQSAYRCANRTTSHTLLHTGPTSRNQRRKVVATCCLSCSRGCLERRGEGGDGAGQVVADEERDHADHRQAAAGAVAGEGCEARRAGGGGHPVTRHDYARAQHTGARRTRSSARPSSCAPSAPPRARR